MATAKAKKSTAKVIALGKLRAKQPDSFLLSQIVALGNDAESCLAAAERYGIYLAPQAEVDAFLLRNRLTGLVPLGTKAVRVPSFNRDGSVVAVRYRFYNAAIRYASESKKNGGAAVVSFVPGSDWPRVSKDTTISICIGEGEKTTNAIAEHLSSNVACIAILGCNGGLKGKGLHPELSKVDWKGRRTYICLDSDATSNPDVAAAESKLAQLLSALGANVLIVRLTPDHDGNKRGADDYLPASLPELEQAFRDAKPYNEGRTVLGGPLHQVVDVSLGLLNSCGVYQRGGVLVQLLLHGGATHSNDGIRRPNEQLVIAPITPEALRVKLNRLAACQRNGRLVDIPLELGRTLTALGEYPDVRRIAGIADAPTLRPDDSILQQRGYDEDSELFLHTDDGWPKTPDQPTRSAALAALKRLCEPFEEFGLDPAAEAAAIAAVLTVAIRSSLPTAPFFGVEAPTAGAGKGLLVDVIGLIGSGQIPAKSTLPLHDESEMRKLITASVMAGDRILCFDNISRGAHVRSAPLDAALTSGVWSDRVLGTNTRVQMPFAITVFLTGNNYSAHVDLTRRGLFIHIDPACERPEERTFRRPDLRGWALANRRKLLTAALTLIRAYATASKRVAVRPLGSFEEWSRRVREPLLWLGMADPVATQARMREVDDEQEELGSVLHALAAAFGTKRFYAAEVVRVAIREPLSSFFGGRDGMVTAKRVGIKLIAQKGRVINGLVLHMGADKHAKTRTFWVEKAAK